MRTFLAIEIPESVKPLIEEQISGLVKEYPQLTWVNMQNYHVTVHFFGEVSDVNGLCARLDELLYDCESFHMYADKGHLFIQHRIVLYLEFVKDKRLEHIVDKVAEDVGDPSAKKRFVPHMTVARYKIPSKQQYYLLKKKMENLKLDFDFPVESLFLYEADLKGQTPVYKKIKEFKLYTNTKTK